MLSTVITVIITVVLLALGFAFGRWTARRDIGAANREVAVEEERAKEYQELLRSERRRHAVAIGENEQLRRRRNDAPQRWDREGLLAGDDVGDPPSVRQADRMAMEARRAPKPPSDAVPLPIAELQAIPPRRTTASDDE